MMVTSPGIESRSLGGYRDLLNPGIRLLEEGNFHLHQDAPYFNLPHFFELPLLFLLSVPGNSSTLIAARWIPTYCMPAFLSVKFYIAVLN